jgi:hypothetical protein
MIAFVGNPACEHRASGPPTKELVMKQQLAERLVVLATERGIDAQVVYRPDYGWLVWIRKEGFIQEVSDHTLVASLNWLSEDPINA